MRSFAIRVAAGFGLAGLFLAEPRLHAALKYVGGLYLLSLAWRIACADSSANERHVVNLPPMTEYKGTFGLACSSSQCRRVTAAGADGPT